MRIVRKVIRQDGSAELLVEVLDSLQYITAQWGRRCACGCMNIPADSLKCDDCGRDL